MEPHRPFSRVVFLRQSNDHHRRIGNSFEASLTISIPPISVATPLKPTNAFSLPLSFQMTPLHSQACPGSSGGAEYCCKTAIIFVTSPELLPHSWRGRVRFIEVKIVNKQDDWLLGMMTEPTKGGLAEFACVPPRETIRSDERRTEQTPKSLY